MYVFQVAAFAPPGLLPVHKPGPAGTVPVQGLSEPSVCADATTRLPIARPNGPIRPPIQRRRIRLGDEGVELRDLVGGACGVGGRSWPELAAGLEPPGLPGAGPGLHQLNDCAPSHYALRGSYTKEYDPH